MSGHATWFLCHGGTCDVRTVPERVLEIQEAERVGILQRHYQQHGEYPDMDGQIAAVLEAEDIATRRYAMLLSAAASNQEQRMTDFSVGEYIEDELRAREWTRDDLARHMGGDFATQRFVVEMLTEIRDDPNILMDDDTAAALGRAFGTSAALWKRLYDSHRRALLAARSAQQEGRETRSPEGDPRDR